MSDNDDQGPGNIPSLAALDPMLPADFARLPPAVQAVHAVRQRLKDEFLASRAWGRAHPSRITLGTNPIPKSEPVRLTSWEGAGEQGDWRGTLLGTGGKKRRW